MMCQRAAAAFVLLVSLSACNSPTGPIDEAATLEVELPWDRLIGRIAFITEGCGPAPNICRGAIQLAQVAGRSVRQIAHGPSTVPPRSMVFAPDGRALTVSAFVSSADHLARYRLFAIDLDDPEPVELRPDAPVGDHQAMFGWSRDGRLALVMSVERDDGTYRSDAITIDDLVLPPVGGSPAELSRITWSPDGSEIVVALRTQRPAPLLYAISIPAGTVSDLMADAVTSDSHTYNPDYSPDGAWIAYAEYGGGRSEIWLLERATGTRSRLTAGARDRSPVWSPDGSAILFIRDERPHLVDIATSTVTRLSRQKVTAVAWTE